MKIVREMGKGVVCLLLAVAAGPVSAQTVEYIHTDALGTPVAVTNSAGAVIERSEYEPYGALLNRPITDGPGFTGHVQDAATGLTYMQQRYYDPGIGRFLSVDPVTANSGTGANFNRYWYANNNPYKFVDPDGRRIEPFGDVEKVNADIEVLNSQPAGRALVERLTNSPNTHYVGYGSKAPGDPADTSPLSPQNASPAPDGAPGSGSGSIVRIDPSQRIGEAGPNGPVEVPGFVKLGHELGHSDAIDQGIQGTDVGGGYPGTTPSSEDHSLPIENSIRREHNIPEREGYIREPVELPPQ